MDEDTVSSNAFCKIECHKGYFTDIHSLQCRYNRKEKAKWTSARHQHHLEIFEDGRVFCVPIPNYDKVDEDDVDDAWTKMTKRKTAEGMDDVENDEGCVFSYI